MTVQALWRFLITCGILIVRAIVHEAKMLAFFKKKDALKVSYEQINEAQHWRPVTTMAPRPQITLSIRCIALWGRVQKKCFDVGGQLRSACFRIAAPPAF